MLFLGRIDTLFRMNNNMQQLHYFVVLARELHFRRAAKFLHIAQPALSRNIHQLEEYVGTPLFDRTSRSVNLTPAGKVFVGEAARMIEQVERSRYAALHASTGHSGTLNLGFTSSSILGELSRLIALFHNNYPEVRVTFRELTNKACVEQLLLGELDLVCTEWRVFEPEIQFQAMNPTPVVLAMHIDHRFAHRRFVYLKDCSCEQFIFPTYYPHHALFLDLMHACYEAGFSPDIVAQTTSMRSAVELVAAGVGVALLCKYPALANPLVVFKPLPDMQFKMEMRLGFRNGDLSPIVANFLRLNTHK